MFQPHQVLHERYQLHTQLGRTGAGRQTWRAIDLETQEAVILKLLAFNPQLQWEDVKLFERESLVLKHLDHPRIPQYRDYFAIDEAIGSGLPWFVLVQEYIPGVSLEEFLDQKRRFRENQAYCLAEDILEILIYLHELSPPVFHRDIKPSNIILGRDKQFYLVDFGAVQDRAKAEGASFTIVGTNGYASPEQLWGRAVAASDLYGLGTTLLHLLTGIPPAELPQENLRLQFRDRALLSPEFADWLEQLVDPSLEGRFSTAREARKALQTHLVQPAKPTDDTVNLARLTLLSVIGLIMGSSLLFLPVALPLRFKEIIPSSLKPPEVEGQQAIQSINRRQQAYFLQQKKFASTIDSLNPSIATQTSNYTYSLEHTEQAVFHYAAAHRKGLRSYVGGVFLIPSRFKPSQLGRSTTGRNKPTRVETRAIVCQGLLPSHLPPPPPVLKNNQPICVAGTVQINP
ncbi:protein kinase domain-containing protein [Pantanalinema rosaneae CENA516]|uniref:protein kinase domain-containing protein n=1 Tax=Pantanalinema rosaneae TaxID=1620701 RepID=UPI003D6E181B